MNLTLFVVLIQLLSVVNSEVKDGTTEQLPKPDNSIYTSDYKPSTYDSKLQFLQNPHRINIMHMLSSTDGQKIKMNPHANSVKTLTDSDLKNSTSVSENEAFKPKIPHGKSMIPNNPSKSTQINNLGLQSNYLRPQNGYPYQSASYLGPNKFYSSQYSNNLNPSNYFPSYSTPQGYYMGASQRFPGLTPNYQSFGMKFQCSYGQGYCQYANYVSPPGIYSQGIFPESQSMYQSSYGGYPSLQGYYPSLQQSLVNLPQSYPNSYGGYPSLQGYYPSIQDNFMNLPQNYQSLYGSSQNIQGYNPSLQSNFMNFPQSYPAYPNSNPYGGYLTPPMSVGGYNGFIDPMNSFNPLSVRDALKYSASNSRKSANNVADSITFSPIPYNYPMMLSPSYISVSEPSMMNDFYPASVLYKQNFDDRNSNDISNMFYRKNNYQHKKAKINQNEYDGDIGSTTGYSNEPDITILDSTLSNNEPNSNFKIRSGEDVFNEKDDTFQIEYQEHVERVTEINEILNSNETLSDYLNSTKTNENDEDQLQIRKVIEDIFTKIQNKIQSKKYASQENDEFDIENNGVAGVSTHRQADLPLDDDYKDILENIQLAVKLMNQQSKNNNSTERNQTSHRSLDTMVRYNENNAARVGDLNQNEDLEYLPNQINTEDGIFNTDTVEKVEENTYSTDLAGDFNQQDYFESVSKEIPVDDYVETITIENAQKIQQNYVPSNTKDGQNADTSVKKDEPDLAENFQNLLKDTQNELIERLSIDKEKGNSGNDAEYMDGLSRKILENFVKAIRDAIEMVNWRLNNRYLVDNDEESSPRNFRTNFGTVFQENENLNTLPQESMEKIIEGNDILRKLIEFLQNPTKSVLTASDYKH